MALVLRILLVIASFVAACVAAAIMVTFGYMVATSTPWPQHPSEIFGVLIISLSLMISLYALVPAMVAIAVAEGFRIRSVLAYGIAGAIGGLMARYGIGAIIDAPGTSFRGMLDQSAEIMAAAGIVAGFVYWALAGRSAGAWRANRSGGPPAAG